MIVITANSHLDPSLHSLSFRHTRCESIILKSFLVVVPVEFRKALIRKKMTNMKTHYPAVEQGSDV